MPTLRERAQLIAEKRAEVIRLETQADTGRVDPVDGGRILDVNETQIKEIRTRTDELDSLQREYEAAELSERLAKNREQYQVLQEPDRKYAPAAPTGDPLRDQRRSINAQLQAQGKGLFYFLEDTPQFKNRGMTNRRFSVEIPDVDLKTLFATTAGFAPANPRTNVIVPFAFRRPVVADLIPQDPTDLSSIKYMEETTSTNAATNVSEGSAKPEATLVYTERTATVEKIAVWIPATEEQLDDVPQMRSLIENRLTLFLQLKEEDDILNGNGTGTMDGFLHKSGTQSQAFSTNNADTIYLGMQKVRGATSFANPSGVIIHPTNWSNIRLQKAATTGEYIMGAPSVNGGQAVGATSLADYERLWGVPVIQTTAITLNTALTGDFAMFSHLSRRMGIRIDVSDSHDTYFTANRLAIRAEERVSLEIYRPAAFCLCTGLS